MTSRVRVGVDETFVAVSEVVLVCGCVRAVRLSVAVDTDDRVALVEPYGVSDTLRVR